VWAGDEEQTELGNAGLHSISLSLWLLIVCGLGMRNKQNWVMLDSTLSLYLYGC
jgi:hypothetical protein